MQKKLIERKNILIYNIASQLITTTIGLLIVVVLLLIFKNYVVTYKKYIDLGIILLFGYAYIEAFVGPVFKVITWQYNINEHQLQFTYGAYKKTTVVIPMNRIQHLTMVENPIANKFNVGRVDVVTTNGTHTLHNITLEEGKQLIQQISTLLFKKAVSAYEEDI